MLVLAGPLRTLLHAARWHLSPFVADSALVPRQHERPNARFHSGQRVEYPQGSTGKGGAMYIGGGVLTLIVIILLLIWLL